MTDVGELGPVFSGRIWMEFDGKHFFGPGRAQLLREIERHGSISAASRELGVSYRAAWGWLRTMSKILGEPLVSTSRGGSAGGRATLTDRGRELLEDYQLAQSRFQVFLTALGHKSSH